MHYNFLSVVLMVVFSAFSTVKVQAISSFNYSDCPSPVIASFSPQNGPEQTLITINGSDFSAVTTVTIGGVNTQFTIVSDTELTAVVPSGADENASITFTTSGACIGNSTQNFTVLQNDCNSANEIYISEVYDSDGGSYGAIELYNPTNTVIALDGVYEVHRYGTIGSPTPSVTINLSGVIMPTSTFIIEMGSTGNSCSGLAPNITLAAGINEDDELQLLKNGSIIDVMITDDEIGYTFIRNANANAPSTTFDLNDWTLLETEDCSDLRSHTANSATAPTLTQPTSETVCNTGIANFSVAVDIGTYTYQWKVLDASGNWVNVVNDANYSGATTNMLIVNGITPTFDGNQYYCELSTSGCNLVSDAVMLTVLDPQVDSLSDVIECTSYTLPALTNGNYYTAPNGSGTMLNAGDVISSTQTIYIYNEVGTAPNTCSNESSFEVTILGTPTVDALADVSECTSYTLPALTNGNYYTATNGSGTMLNAGDVISSTQTIYIYNEVGTAPNSCSNESSFEVAIVGTPMVDALADVSECTSYTLPALVNGNYFTATNGSGTMLNAGDVISSTQIIYIYNEVGTAPNTCSNASSFEVTILGTPAVDVLADITECTSFSLPALTNGNYYTTTNGSGTMLNAGDVISSTQTIYIYNEIGSAPNICSNESSFEVAIVGTPMVDALADVSECTNYTLPALTNGNYYTATNGSGTMLNAGDVISSTQTIYIYNEVGTAPNTCSNASSFEVTIIGTPTVDSLADVSECTSYTLPALTNGNYYTATNGSGTMLNAGDVINNTQTIYIYNEVGTAPNSCSNESSFEVEILGATDFDLTAANIAVFENTLTVTMTDTSINYQYAVDSGLFQSNSVFTGLSAGVHTLYVQDENGCVQRSIDFEIVVEEFLFFPPFFTPNGDNDNPVWLVRDPNHVVKEIYIFNRFGKVLDRLSSQRLWWDGVYNGHLLENNDYWYLATLTNGTEVRGHFALKR